jgi:ribosomal protein L12E/L44/L45/RPP1/RPP2
VNYYVLKDVSAKSWTKGQVVNLDEKESAEWVKNGTLVAGSTAPAAATAPAPAAAPAPVADEHEQKAPGSRR